MLMLLWRLFLGLNLCLVFYFLDLSAQIFGHLMVSSPPSILHCCFVVGIVMSYIAASLYQPFAHL